MLPILLVFGLFIGLFTGLLFQGQLANSYPKQLPEPVYPSASVDTAALHKKVAPFLKMSESELLALIPPQGGFRYSGSPATQQGAQENNLTWELSLGDKVRCIYTGLLLPNDQYPENRHIDVTTPTGKIQRFHYHQAPDGKKYWFEARRWYMQRELMEQVAYQLAVLYRSDPNRYASCGKRSALIMVHFAKLFPDYIITHDYPAKEKAFLDKAAHRKAAKQINHHFIELTRWSSWGYHDMSVNMILAFDQLRGTPALPERIHPPIRKMFDDMIEFTIPFEQVPITNMHPTMWTQKAIAGNVLYRPELLEMAETGVKRLIAEQFYYDGFYKEVTVSYHHQTVDGLISVLKTLYPRIRYEKLFELIENKYPTLARALKATEAYRLPDGRYASYNDTHWTDRQASPIRVSTPHLLPAAGHAVLGAGKDEQQYQVHLGYSGYHGHDHYGNLNIVMYAHGREMISDIGYTHTRARAWTMSTAAHNTVVVDGVSQSANSDRAGKGDLVLHNVELNGFQVVEVSANNVYPERVSVYKRALIAVQPDQESLYVVDLFQVTGGNRHDWFLHGSADEDQTLEFTGVHGKPIPTSPQRTLVPEDVEYEELREQGSYPLIWKNYWPYGHLMNIHSGVWQGPLIATFRYTSNSSIGFQTWLMSGADVIYHFRSWAVRGADEDQGILDKFLRAGMMMRSEKVDSRFVAVHVPFNGSPAVSSVNWVSSSEREYILRVVHRRGTDYVIYRKDENLSEVVIEDSRVRVSGKITLVRDTPQGRQIFRIGKIVATLSGFDQHSLFLKGEHPLKTGQTAIVHHGINHTTPFHIDSVRMDNGITQVFVREPLPFRQEADGSFNMTTFPFYHLPGPHEVSIDYLESSSN